MYRAIPDVYAMTVDFIFIIIIFFYNFSITFLIIVDDVYFFRFIDDYRRTSPIVRRV